MLTLSFINQFNNNFKNYDKICIELLNYTYECLYNTLFNIPNKQKKICIGKSYTKTGKYQSNNIINDIDVLELLNLLDSFKFNFEIKKVNEKRGYNKYYIVLEFKNVKTNNLLFQKLYFNGINNGLSKQIDNKRKLDVIKRINFLIQLAICEEKEEIHIPIFNKNYELNQSLKQIILNEVIETPNLNYKITFLDKEIVNNKKKIMAKMPYLKLFWEKIDNIPKINF